MKARRIIIGPGNESDYKQALELVKDIKPETVMADWGYDVDWFIDTLIAMEVTNIVIPSRSSRKVQRIIDEEHYKQRNKVERFFSRLKNWRRVATRYDKTARNFNAFAALAAAIINFTVNAA